MVSAAFVTYKDKILLFHRDDKPNIKDPDCWDIIGGHLEEGELPEEGLIREIKEEINVVVNSPIFLKEIIDYWGTKTFLYKVELSDEQLENIKLGDEGKEIKFFKFSELSQLKVTHNLSKYIEEDILNLYPQ